MACGMHRDEEEASYGSPIDAGSDEEDYVDLEQEGHHTELCLGTRNIVGRHTMAPTVSSMCHLSDLRLPTKAGSTFVSLMCPAKSRTSSETKSSTQTQLQTSELCSDRSNSIEFVRSKSMSHRYKIVPPVDTVKLSHKVGQLQNHMEDIHLEQESLTGLYRQPQTSLRHPSELLTSYPTSPQTSRGTPRLPSREYSSRRS